MTVWTVIAPGRCPTCGANADNVCDAERHRCSACGCDRGPCDQAPRHIQQLALF